MTPLRILHLSDGRPGHYHLAEGVIAALERVRESETRTVPVKRRFMVPARFLRMLAGSRWCSPERLLKLGYGLAPQDIAPADLVVSSGGETLPANVAAKGLLGAENIFVGSRRGIPVEGFSLIVSSYERHENLPRYLVSLKPSAMDPASLGRPEQVPVLGADNPPKLAGLLIGGDSGLFKYRDEEWHRLFAFAREVSKAWGTRWLISTSRRTPDRIAEDAFDLAKDKDTVADFIDYRLAGPGTLSKIFGKADMIVCSEDSSTMISEAVWARLPAIGVSPAHHAFKPEEREYRMYMKHRDWCRYVPLAALTMKRFGKKLGEIKPLSENPLDKLARQLREKLPGLF